MDTVKEQQRRSAWDREVARKYGIDLVSDKQFLDKVWADAGNTFGDFEDFDAFVEGAWSYYSLRREQPKISKSNEGFGGRWQRGGDTRLRDSNVKLDDDSKARVTAF